MEKCNGWNKGYYKIKEIKMEQTLEDQVYKAFKEGLDICQICEKFNLCLGEACDILKKREWKELGIKEGN